MKMGRVFFQRAAYGVQHMQIRFEIEVQARIAELRKYPPLDESYGRCKYIAWQGIGVICLQNNVLARAPGPVSEQCGEAEVTASKFESQIRATPVSSVRAPSTTGSRFTGNPRVLEDADLPRCRNASI